MEYEQIANYCDKPFIENIPNYIAQHKACKLTLGKGILFKGADKKILDLLNNFYYTEKIYEKLWKAEYQNSVFGGSIQFVSKALDGSNHWYVANPVLNSRVGKINEIEQVADLWLQPDQTDNGTLMHLYIDKENMRIDYYNASDEILVGISERKFPNHLKPKSTQTFKHGYKMLPIIQIQNLPRPLPYGNSTTFNYYPDWFGSQELINQVQDIWKKIMLEREINRTRYYGQLTPQQMKDSIANSGGSNMVLADGFLNAGTNTYANGVGGSGGLQVFAGTPAFDKYATNYHMTKKTILKNAGYDYEEGEGDSYQNKTKSLMNNKSDIETTNVKQAFRRQQYFRLFDLIVIDEFPDLWDEKNSQWKDNERPYDFEFIANGIVDELMQNEIINSRLENGTLSRSMAIQQYEYVDKFIADDLLKDIDKDFNEQAKMLGDNENKDTKGDSMKDGAINGNDK